MATSTCPSWCRSVASIAIMDVNFSILVPFIGVIGGREAENGTITIRRFGNPKQQTLSIDDLLVQMTQEVQDRALPPGFGLDES